MSKTRLIIASIILLVFALGARDCDCDCGDTPQEQAAASSEAEPKEAGQLPTGE